MRRSLVFALLILSTIESVNAGQLEDGVAASNRGDYTAALQLWRPLAEQGNAQAQHNLGVMYANGRGVPKDDATAVRWYRKAADQGLADAQFNLGIKYELGRGVAKDDATSVLWYRKAVRSGRRARPVQPRRQLPNRPRRRKG
jgi:TPR repeat protein